MTVRRAEPADIAELATVAAATFPLACPPSATPENIAAFIAETLSEQRFSDYLTADDRIVLVAHDDAITGYAMLIHGVPDNPDVQRAVESRPAIELSKIYVAPAAHGTGVAGTLMTEALRHGTDLGFSSMWLGVNQENQRAQRFYRKHGFQINGTKTFQLGSRVEQDYVMVRAL